MKLYVYIFFMLGMTFQACAMSDLVFSILTDYQLNRVKNTIAKETIESNDRLFRFYIDCDDKEFNDILDQVVEESDINDLIVYSEINTLGDYIKMWTSSGGFFVCLAEFLISDQENSTLRSKFFGMLALASLSSGIFSFIQSRRHNAVANKIKKYKTHQSDDFVVSEV